MSQADNVRMMRMEQSIKELWESLSAARKEIAEQSATISTLRTEMQKGRKVA